MLETVMKLFKLVDCNLFCFLTLIDEQIYMIYTASLKTLNCNNFIIPSQQQVNIFSRDEQVELNNCIFYFIIYELSL